MAKIPKNLDPFSLTGCFIAGGAVLSVATKTPISDYDVYPKNLEGLSDIIVTLMEQKCFIVNMSDRAITFKSNDVVDRDGNRAIVQVMIFDFFPTPEHIFNLFDFTVCMGAFDCDTSEYTFHKDFYPDIATKTLRFNPNTAFPLASMIRVNKYVNKGYYINKFEFAKVALAIANKGLPTSWDELESQIGGSYGVELRLQTEDKEFSYDNALEILSEIEYDANQLVSSEENLKSYSNTTADDILNCFITEEKEYVVLNGDNFFIDDSYFIGERFSSQLFECLNKPTNFKHTKATRLFAYKASENSTALVNGGNYLKITKDAAFKTRNKWQDVYLVSFDIENSKCYGYNDVIGYNAKLEKKINSDNAQIDDVLDLLAEKICT